MANNKLHGYTPTTTKENEGNRLNKFNPYEFRKGMDYELVNMGCARLAESTPEEREKATESVLKNLEEHQAYYSGLIQYESKSGRNYGTGEFNEASFKSWLKEFTEEYRMKEVKNGLDSSKETKQPEWSYKGTQLGNTDKMSEKNIHKYDKSDYTIALKEAIKKEIKSIITEDEDKEPSKKDVKKAGMSLSKTKDKLVKLKDKKQSLMDKRKSMFDAYKDKIKNLDPDKSKKEFDKYAKKQEPVTKEIKDIEAEMKSLEKTLEEARVDEREMRRNAAKTMMGKDVHMEILNIVKEAGISLKEGSDGVKIYYEIAKTAYMEGLTAGMKSNI
jgi:hypothetical protein